MASGGAVSGVNCVRKILADGSAVYRYYAWRGKGAPCFWTSPHRPVKKPLPQAFVEALQEARKKAGAPNDTFDGIAQLFLSSPGFLDKAKATRADYRRLVDAARERFGTANLAVMSDPRFRGAIIKWRDTLAASPRSADLSVLAVQMVLEHGRNLGLLGVNAAAGIPSLYSAPDDKRPWTDAEMALFTTGAPTHVADAFELIRHLALRRTDAIAITWGADKGTHVAWAPSKGRRHKRQAVIPILPEARAFLDDLRKRNAASTDVSSATMLATSRKRPWKAASSITHAFQERWRALHEAGLALSSPDEWPTPHRLRNNAATMFMIAGLDDRTIADAMGWSVRDVENMRRVYVDREAVVSAAVIRLSERNRK